MRRNVLAGSLVVIAITAAVALAMADGYRASASEASAAARAALQVTGGEWATLAEPSEAGTWKFHVVRSDGTSGDVTLDRDLQVVAVGNIRAAEAAPARTYDASTVQARFAQAQSAPPDPSRHESQWSAVSPADAERAAAAALKATGGGTVHDVDRDVEGGATWEVEITTTDGRAVDVLLDAQFNVLSTGGESDNAEFGQRGGHSRDDDGDRDDDHDDDD